MSFRNRASSVRKVVYGSSFCKVVQLSANNIGLLSGASVQELKLSLGLCSDLSHQFLIEGKVLVFVHIWSDLIM